MNVTVRLPGPNQMTAIFSDAEFSVREGGCLVILGKSLYDESSDPFKDRPVAAYAPGEWLSACL